MKKTRTEKIVISVSLLGVLLLFAFFLKDIMIPLFSMQLNNDVDGAKALLTSRGVLGGLAVSLIEALQMVVVFIPAEFIQVTSGLSYPFYIALLLCDFGVCLGASIIFLLVRAFKFDTGRSRKTNAQIEKMSSKKGDRNISMLMYLLFITPIIPFGAICYYASSTEIRYRRYILTVATGVIPSIITSNIIGAGVRSFIMNAIPLWVLILIIIFMMIVLFVLLWLFLDKIYFKGQDKTPGSAAYFLCVRAASFWRKYFQRLTIDCDKLEELQPPFIVLCNHVSFFDFYYMIELMNDYKPSYVVNHHICSLPVFRKLYVKCGIIPKKMFYPDTAAVKIMRMIRSGYPVVVFSEGRLSIDGRNSVIVEDAAPLYKKLKVPVVLCNIKGAYFTYPKWRGKFFRGDVNISVTRVIKPDELENMTVDDLSKAISSALTYNESDNVLTNYNQRNKAKNLEHMLYRCASCGALYTTKSKGNDLYCTSCGSTHHINENYTFDGEIKSIPMYYDIIRDFERKDLFAAELKMNANVKIYSDKEPKARKENGVCTLNKDYFTYESDNITFSIPIEKIPALAFSVNSEFEIYHDNELYYFYPVENRTQVIRWSLLIDLFREERINNV